MDADKVDRPIPKETPSLDIPNNNENNTDQDKDFVNRPNPQKGSTQPADIKLQQSSLLPPDLHRVSDEIDHYISLLQSTSQDDESSPPDVPIFVEQFAVLVEAKIEDYDSGGKWSQLTEEDSISFLQLVNRVSSLSKALSEFSSEYKYAYSISRIGGILQRAMSHVEEEFKSLLEDYKIPDSDHGNGNKIKPNQSTSSSSNEESGENSPVVREESKFPGYPDEILSKLIKLSKAMIAGGYETECCQVYFVERRNAFEESLHKLGFEKYSIDDVQKMHWESLEREIVVWIKTFKQCANVKFSSERKLSDAVFSDHPWLSEGMFRSLSHIIIIHLLNFAEAVALTKRAAEKLFKFIDIYETLRDVLSTIGNLFPCDEWVNELKTEASMIRSRLGEAMILIFRELENSIKSDSAKTAVPGGAVHPLTSYTLNYLVYACEYKETLEQVFREHQNIERANSEARGSEFDSQGHNNETAAVVVKQSPFQSQITKVMDFLDTNLEAKSKLYKDPCLSLIFMMNNGRYILQKIKGSTEINGLMDSTWCRKRSSELRQYHKNYQRETWGKLLSCLHPDGLTVNGKVVKPVLKEKFKSFNAMFEEIHKTQSSWVVSDEQLQSELRVSISNMVIPAYRSFLGRFSQVFTPGRQTGKYVKYQPEDIETYIEELFDGNSAAHMGRKKL